VIDRDVRLLEARRHLELAWRHLVMPRDDRDAELVQLVLDFSDARLDALRDAAEVVVLELLAARRCRADERPTRHHEIGTEREVAAVDEEILLLGSKRRVDALHALVAEELEEPDGAIAQGVRAAEQGSELVERLTVVANEDRWNAERLDAGPFGDEDGARRIPRRISARLPGGAQPARGKAGRVRLALNQL
jgi:hypothetical protein